MFPWADLEAVVAADRQAQTALEQIQQVTAGQLTPPALQDPHPLWRLTPTAYDHKPFEFGAGGDQFICEPCRRYPVTDDRLRERHQRRVLRARFQNHTRVGRHRRQVQPAGDRREDVVGPAAQHRRL